MGWFGRAKGRGTDRPRKGVAPAADSILESPAPLRPGQRHAGATPEPPAPVRLGSEGSSVVDNAVYREGRRVEPESLEQTYELVRESRGFGWIGLYRPSREEIEEIAAEFGLHALAVEDALEAHQRPKLERYDDTLFVVLRPARYVDPSEVVDVGELHLFVGPDFVVTVRHSESPDLGAVRRRMEADPELLAIGPEAVLYAIVDQIVDDYDPVLRGVANDLDEIESQVFEGDIGVSRRIYELGREIIEFQRAVLPLLDLFASLRSGFEKYKVDIELQRHLRDVEDHAKRVSERIAAFRDLLRDMLTVNAAVVGQRQNEEMRRMTEISLAQNEEVKKISAWAAVLFAPTIIAGVYGMNFDRMPELHWLFGYPFALALMVVGSLALWSVMKWRDWI